MCDLSSVVASGFSVYSHEQASVPINEMEAACFFYVSLALSNQSNHNVMKSAKDIMKA